MYIKFVENSLKKKNVLELNIGNYIKLLSKMPYYCIMNQTIKNNIHAFNPTPKKSTSTYIF